MMKHMIAKVTLEFDVYYTEERNYPDEPDYTTVNEIYNEDGFEVKQGSDLYKLVERRFEPSSDDEPYDDGNY